MGKVHKFRGFPIQKITGGRDPQNLVEEFISRRGFDPDECLKQKTADSIRWMLTLASEEELEILLENIKTPNEATVYMGVNVMAVPLRDALVVLATALEIADGLVSIKLSLVGHYLVLSTTLGTGEIDIEDLERSFKLVTAQQEWFRNTLGEELGWTE